MSYRVNFVVALLCFWFIASSAAQQSLQTRGNTAFVNLAGEHLVRFGIDDVAQPDMHIPDAEFLQGGIQDNWVPTLIPKNKTWSALSVDRNSLSHPYSPSI